jgi:nitroreductase/Pyruvate/2-oxoacid:ferredoxin oxidoreductase delta subunit
MPRLEILTETCSRCGSCVAACPLLCLTPGEANEPPSVRENGENYCISCGHCAAICPTSSVQLNGKTGADFENAPSWNSPDAFEQFSQVVKSRRSIRKYESRPVQREMLDRLLDLCRWTPTALNIQPVRWIVVNDAVKVHQLAEKVIDYFRREKVLVSVVGAWDQGIDMIHRDAPCLVIAHADKTGRRSKVDCTIAVQTLDYAAPLLGLGACWAGFFMNAAANDPSIGELLGLPEEHAIEAALMVGYPKEQYLRVPKRNEAEVRYILPE